MRSDVGRPVSRLAAVVFSFAAIVAAQSVVVPGAMDGVEGGGGTNIPFGSNLACRYQVIFDAEELPWTGPRLITGVSLRADNNTPDTAIAAKGFLDVSVLMSTSPKTAATASTKFADNRGTDATWVVTHRIMQLPAQPALPAGPRPATISFPFTVPWAYGLVPVTNGQPPPTSLLVEVWIHSQPSGSYRIDNLSSCIAPTSEFGQRGPACTVPGNPPPDLTADVSMLAGSTYTWHLQHAPANAVWLLFLDLGIGGGLFGNPAWPLPYPMFDPADPTMPSAALAPLGWPAPDCWLNVSPLLVLAGTCDAAGVGHIAGAVPPGRSSVGVSYFAQAVVVAPTANPLRLVTSLGRETTVCGPLGVARVYAFYDAALPEPATGSVSYGVGPVIEVQ
jgi:hypothetical protein